MPELAEIIVVDNASTDGTGEWLATPAAAASEPAVVARTLDRNAAAPAGSTRDCGWRSIAARTWSG